MSLLLVSTVFFLFIYNLLYQIIENQNYLHVVLQIYFVLFLYFNLYVFCLALPPPARDPCNPSPCGYNTQCNGGVCTCLPEFQGNPYAGCRPECVLNQDCPRDRACIRSKCTDPCPGTCGTQATCIVMNHIPTCSCPEGYSGNPFIICNQVPRKIICIFLF